MRCSCIFYLLLSVKPRIEERGGSVCGQRSRGGGLRRPGAAAGRAWKACQLWGDAMTMGVQGTLLPNFFPRQEPKVAGNQKRVSGPLSSAQRHIEFDTRDTQDGSRGVVYGLKISH